MSEERREFFDNVRGRLMAVLIELSDRLSHQEQTWANEFLDANELGLALEMLADWLSEAERPITADGRARMLALAAEMEIGDRINSALQLCPARSD